MIKDDSNTFVSVADKMPEIVRMWPPLNNGLNTSYSVSYGSPKKIWLKCSEGPDHEWSLKAKALTSKKVFNCPFCVNKMYYVTNNIFNRFKDLHVKVNNSM